MTTIYCGAFLIGSSPYKENGTEIEVTIAKQLAGK